MISQLHPASVHALCAKRLVLTCPVMEGLRPGTRILPPQAFNQ
jgi:hypothetical protein